MYIYIYIGRRGLPRDRHAGAVLRPAHSSERGLRVLEGAVKTTTKKYSETMSPWQLEGAVKKK